MAAKQDEFSKIIGMRKDLGHDVISEDTGRYAFDIRNMRISTDNNNSVLCLTNEKGTKALSFTFGKYPTNPSTNVRSTTITQLNGAVIGQSVLNNNLVVFTHGTLETIKSSSSRVDDYTVGPDYIYKIYQENSTWKCKCLFTGDLNFSTDNPIECIPWYENNQTEKVYWIDGRNQPRVINIALEDPSFDENSFNFLPSLAPQEIVTITKETSSTSAFSAGTVQYCMSYINENGVESTFFYISPLYYATNTNRGGAPDDTATVASIYKINISNLNSAFSKVRIYSIFKSAPNTEAVVKCIYSENISGDVELYDDNTLGYTLAGDLLYLGVNNKQYIIPQAFEVKQDKMFFGNYSLLERRDLQNIRNALSGADIEYFYKDQSVSSPKAATLNNSNFYCYNYQLNDSSYSNTSYKANETYRFGIQLIYKNGEKSEALFIKDLKNSLYPNTISQSYYDSEGGNIYSTLPKVHSEVYQNIGAQADLSSLYDLFTEADVVAVVPLIVLPKESEREVIAQGIINPTVYNVGERNKGVVHTRPSWFYRFIPPYGNSSEYSADSSFTYKDSMSGAYVSTWLLTLNYYKDGEEVTFNPEHLKYTNLIGFNDGVYSEDSNGNVNEYSGTAVPAFPYTSIINYRMGEDTIVKYQKHIYKGQEFSSVNKKDPLFFNFREVENQSSRQDDTNYKIDTSFVTFYSPDIEFNQNAPNFSFENCKFRIVGRVPITSLYAEDFCDIDTEDIDAVNYGEVGKWHKRIVQILAGNSGTADSNGYDTYGIDSWGNSYHTFSGYKASKYAFRYLLDSRVKCAESDYPAYYLYSPYATTRKVKHLITDYTHTEGKFWIEDKTILNYHYSNTTDYLTGYSSNPEISISNEKCTVLSCIDEVNGVAILNGKYRYKGVCSGDLNTPPIFYDSNLKANAPEDLNIYAPSTKDLSTAGLKDYFAYTNRTDLGNDKASGSYKQGVFTLGADNYKKVYTYNNYGGARFTREGSASEVEGISSEHWRETLYAIFPYIGRSENKAYLGYIPKSYQQIGETDTTFGNNLGWDIDYGYLYKSFYYNTNLGPYATVGSLHMNDTVRKDDEKPYSKALDFDDLNEESVLITYNSPQHAVLNIEIPLPIKQHYYETSVGEIIDKKYTWENEDSSLPYTIENPKWGLREDGTAVQLSSADDYGFLWLGEIYREVPNKFGGTKESDIAKNSWIIAGPMINIEDVGNGTLIQWLHGDTYYQRYDNLKTFPYSTEDPNKIVDILSFMVESRVNLDGRYDSRKGMSVKAEDYTDATNFNLINGNYTQNPDFFLYYALDYSQPIINEFTNSLTWTLSKVNGEDIDYWTSVTLANTFDLDGKNGAISRLVTWRNFLIAFQEKAINTVQYMENYQLSAVQNDANTVPIEITNSATVAGYKPLEHKVGNINKWAIATTPKGVFFVDDLTKGFYELAENQGTLAAVDIGNAKGLEKYIASKCSTNTWDSINFNNSVLYYDNITKDVYIIWDDEALSYNDQFETFTSFYSYGNTSYVFNLRDKTLAIRTNGTSSTIYEMYTGPYNKYFDNARYTPFSVTFLSAGHGSGIQGSGSFSKDKIFNTIEFTSDSFVSSTIDPSIGEYVPSYTFDNASFWNEYQRNENYSLIDKKDRVSPLKKRFRNWYLNIPRNQYEDGSDRSTIRDRFRNPWLFVKLERQYPDNVRTTLHSVKINYFD